MSSLRSCAAFCEVGVFCAVDIGISVWRVVIFGVFRCGCAKDLGFAIEDSAEMAILPGWECAQNVSKPLQTCGVVQILLKLT